MDFLEVHVTGVVCLGVLIAAGGAGADTEGLTEGLGDWTGDPDELLISGVTGSSVNENSN